MMKFYQREYFYKDFTTFAFFSLIVYARWVFFSPSIRKILKLVIQILFGFKIGKIFENNEIARCSVIYFSSRDFDAV